MGGCWCAFPGVWVFPPFPCAAGIGCHEVIADDHVKGIFFSPCLPFLPFIMHWRKEGDHWAGYADECGKQGGTCCEQKRAYASGGKQCGSGPEDFSGCACERGLMWNGVVWRMC